MITTSPSLTRLRRRLRLAALSVPAVVGLALLGSPAAYAKPIPSNLGNGLDKLVASNLAITNAKASGLALHDTVVAGNKTYTDEATAAVATSALSDAQGRLLVRITLDGTVPVADLRKAIEGKLASLNVSAVDTTYRGVGVMNAYVDVADVPALASTHGVAAVVLEWKPRHNAVKPVIGPVTTGLGSGAPGIPITANPVATANPATPSGISPTVGETLTKVGTTFDQGVTQHGIDQINKTYNTAATLDLEGQTMQIACISNSFAANTASPASVDVTNGDLPGAGSTVNTTPVYVFLDDTSSATSDDEGRGMCQIVYKMAPKAAIAFGTADTGEVGFANVIRGLAGIAGYTNSGQTFAADTICDDVGYFDEPFFQDGIISGGIEDAATAGASYFSSAANDIGTNGYDSDTRWVTNGTGLTAAAGNAALTGTNINLTGVPTNLYAGGFHNFNPSGLDVAQTVNIAANNTVPLTFQWNDPYDQNTAATGATQFFSGSGTYTTAPVYFTVPTTVTAGTKYQFVETANGDGFDAIVTVYKSDGTTVIVGPQDTGVDETVRFSAPANDTGFVVEINHYGTTTGAFTLTGSSFTGFSTPSISTSLSVLVFNLTTGAYISASSLTADATTTNEPIQLGYTNKPSGASQVQYVIARATVPANAAFPTHIRYLLPGNGRAGYGPAEYFSYNTVTTGGHAMSPSCNGCAAYSVFRPSLPETFTSPGPVTIYYDKNDNALNPPQVRLQPRVAFADGANVSANLSAVFASDNADDPDTTQGQFYGTSATGPHAAAIAALVLQNKGGRRSVTPTQMTSLLERSTLPHDLDPNFSSGSTRVLGGTTGTGKITITISSDGAVATTAGTRAQGGDDTTSFSVSYVGGSSVTSLVFNPAGTQAGAGAVSGGNNGVTYGSADATIGGTVTYFENSLPGVAFIPTNKAFTLNTTLTDSVKGATASTTNAPVTGSTGFYTLSITVPSGNFTSSNELRFTVGRGLAFGPDVGSTYNAVTNSTTATAYYSADIFGGGVILPEGTVNSKGMTFSGTTADGGTFTGTIVNRIGSGWAKTDGYGFVNAVTAVSQTVQ